MRELVLGGQRSGKSRLAEARAARWLDGGTGREALLLVTAQAGDDEMRARIDRHRADRAQRLPRLGVREVGAAAALAPMLRALAAPQRLLVVDCLTLWLAQALMPPAGTPAAGDAEALCDALLGALQDARGPVLLVSNEIGLGVVPMGRETRAVVDALGRLHQRLAAGCERVTLMVAGLPLVLKPRPQGAAEDTMEAPR